MLAGVTVVDAKLILPTAVKSDSVGIPAQRTFHLLLKLKPVYIAGVYPFTYLPPAVNVPVKTTPPLQHPQ